MADNLYSSRIVVIFIIYGALPMILSELKMEQLQRNMMTPDKFGLALQGPITARLTSMTLCKGPKRNNCSDNTKLETVDQSSNRYRNATFTLSFSKTTLFLKAKLVVSRQNEDGVSVPGILKILDRPCNQFFLRPILKKYLNVAAPRCVATKGTFVSNINCEQMLLELMGFQFFYGTYRSEVTLISTDCNIFCLTVEFILEPKVADKPKRTRS